MVTTAGKRPIPTSQTPPGEGRGSSGTVLGPPYSVREAAALLGVSQDAIEANYQQMEGFRVGRRILIPRRVVDRLVGASEGELGDEQEQPPVVERVLALLPLLAHDERVKVAQVALAAPLG